MIDASALVAAVIDTERRGSWALAEVAAAGALAIPDHALFEAVNGIRRLERTRRIGEDEALSAHRSLLELELRGTPYHLLATRVWELRHNLTVYDAAYVALAELLDCPLVTCDVRLAGAPGIDCEVRMPPGA